MLAFDIETGPQPEEVIGPMFDPDAVKLGNLKDPEKITAKIAEARKDFITKAALCATTGRLLATGFKYGADDDAFSIITEAACGCEESLLIATWETLTNAHSKGSLLSGHYVKAFDLPFLLRRSWLQGVDAPTWLFDSNRRYYSPSIKDTLEIWQCGNRQEYIKLEVIDRALGGPGKPDGIDGSDFDRLYHGTDEERDQALDYLLNDIEMQWRVSEALQVI